MIYYPNFEPDQNWLKFALLYFDKVQTIVPFHKRHLLSPLFLEIKERSELLDFCDVTFDIAYSASLRAIEEAEIYLQNPARYSQLFNVYNVISRWQDDSNWTYEIHNEKFSYDWFEFCDRNRLGQRSRNGLILDGKLAFLYMTQLGKAISDDQGLPLITDINRFDRYISFRNVFSRQDQQIQEFARGVLELQLPRNLAEIPIDEIVDFRNQNVRLRKAFTKEVARIQEKIAAGYSPKKFVENYQNAYGPLALEIARLGLTAGTGSFAFYALSEKIATGVSSIIKETLSAAGGIFSGCLSLTKSLNDSQGKRFCKSYLGKVKMLNN